LRWTGEITLRETFLLSGCSRKKALAAKRSGIKKVIVPKKNEAEVRELPNEIKENMTFCSGGTMMMFLSTRLLNEP